ncbi:hypothetical protein ACVWWK_003390 [Bradyrhizobium sp. LB9.1b]
MKINRLLLGAAAILAVHLSDAQAGSTETILQDTHHNRIDIQVDASPQEMHSWESLFERFIEWLHANNFARTISPGQGKSTSLAPTSLPLGSDSTLKPQATPAPSQSVVEGITCSVKVTGAGRMKDVNIVVASAQHIETAGLATVRARGANSGVFIQDIDLALKSGEHKNFTLVHTNFAENAVLTGEIKTTDQKIPCK